MVPFWNMMNQPQQSSFGAFLSGMQSGSPSMPFGWNGQVPLAPPTTPQAAPTWTSDTPSFMQPAGLLGQQQQPPQAGAPGPGSATPGTPSQPAQTGPVGLPGAPPGSGGASQASSQSSPEWQALINWLTSKMGGGATSSSNPSQAGILSALGPIIAGGTSIYSR